MKHTIVARSLTLQSLRNVRVLWRQNVRPLTLAELQGPESHGQIDLAQCELKAAQRTHTELELRSAHLLRDFLFLPYQAMANPCLRLVYEKYASAYTMHEAIGTPTCHECASEYWVALSNVFDDHKDVTRLMSHGRRQLVALEPAIAPTLNSFYNRFFESRIGTHLLGANFLHHFPAPPGTHRPLGADLLIQQSTNAADSLRYVIDSLAMQPGDNAPVELQCSSEMSIQYIPAHFVVALREILQQAWQATLQEAHLQGSDPAPIRIQVSRSQSGVFVTVSDRGGGIPDVDGVWTWGSQGAPGLEEIRAVGRRQIENEEELELMWGTPNCIEAQGSGFCPHPDVEIPLGFGLPLARLVVRYFGGNVRIQSLHGHGTKAYLHIPELQQGLWTSSADTSLDSWGGV